MITTDQVYLQNYIKGLIHKYHKTAEHQVYSDPVAFAEYKLECGKVRARIPVRFISATPDDIADPDLRGSLTDYINRFDEYRTAGIAPVLPGKNGRGKTLFGCLILIEALRRGHTAHFTKVKHCIDQLTSGFRDEEEKRKFKEDLINKDFLMIDDLGDELQTATPNSNLREFTVNHILRDRADNKKPTIITTNFRLDQLVTQYDGKVSSIIDEIGLIVETSGPDYRKEVIKGSINPK